uniref:hypothetical protein n=1 Tax=Candidatus Cryptobacteroides bacterium TaxID=3085639 RepID=UPI0040286CCF
MKRYINSILKDTSNKLDSDIEKDIRNFLGKEGIDFLKESKENGRFYVAYNSFLYGGIGTQIRNYIRVKFPDIDNIMSYQEYEDYTTNIVLNIINK